MKFVYPEIDRVFDTAAEKVNTLIVENQGLLLRLLSDIQSQLDGNDGRCVISDDGKVFPTAKNAELLTQFVPFEMNKKTLLNKAMAALEKSAVEGERYGQAMELLQMAEAFLLQASFDLNCDLSFENITVTSLIKASGMSFREDYDSLGEKIIDYMELVTEFDRRKLFLLYNLRSFISDEETEKFLETVLSHNYNVLMIESGEHPRLLKEQRYIVDSDLCEIC